MNRFLIRGLVVACLLLPEFSAKAQDKPPTEAAKAQSPRQDGTQLKVQIVFSEYEGEKKIKSLPYTLLVLAGNDRDFNWSKIRMGDRMPVATGKDGGGVQFQYLDIGTNIDCRAFAATDGRFRLYMNLERSWVQSDTQLATAKEPSSIEIEFHQPTLRQFRSELNLALRDGQTIETNFATDPVSGKIIKLEITMNVMK